MESGAEISGVRSAARGGRFTLDDLPPPDTRRWVVRRKAAVVTAVQAGLLSLEDACIRYQLSYDEFHAWTRGFRRFGLSGLKATRLHAHR